MTVRVSSWPTCSSVCVLFREIDSSGFGTGTTVTLQVAVFSPTAAVIVAVPGFTAVMVPSFTVATVLSEEVHATVLSSVVSAGWYVTIRVSSWPTCSSVSVLFSEIDSSGFGTGTTVTLQVAAFLPTVAVIVAVPGFTAVMVPSFTVATVLSEEVHATVLSSVVSAGWYVTIRVSSWPTCSSVFALFSEIDSNGFGTGTTVTLQVAVFSPIFAVIVASPGFTAVIFPSSTVATISSEEVHATALSSVVSAGWYVTIRVSSWPTCSSVCVLFREIDSSGFGTGTTVTLQVAVFLPTVAVIVAVPGFTAVMVPPFTVATVLSEEVHATALSSVVSAGWYVTIRVSSWPTCSSVCVLFREIDSSGCFHGFPPGNSTIFLNGIAWSLAYVSA